MRTLHALLYAALAGFVPAQFALAQSANDSEALMLVASPQLREPSYFHTVVLAVPLDSGQHVGVIINRPTRRTLASLFPEHEPSRKVAEPVFFGGPMSGPAVFAVVRSEDNPGRGSIALMKNLFLALSVDTVDRIIEQTPNQARYYVGNVIWRPGELSAEIDRKLWKVMNADTGLVFRKNTERLWEDLWEMARAITADAGVQSVMPQPHLTPRTPSP